MALELEDSDDDDKMERKRRRQLTERWSMLEEDSVRRDDFFRGVLGSGGKRN